MALEGLGRCLGGVLGWGKLKEPDKVFVVVLNEYIPIPFQTTHILLLEQEGSFPDEQGILSLLLIRGSLIKRTWR